MMTRLKRRMETEGVWDQTAYNEEMWWATLPGEPAFGVSARSLLLPRAPPYYGSSTTTRGNKDPYYPWWAVLCNT